MELNAYNITFQIYARNEEEAERGRKAIVQFIKIMRDNGAGVTGNKLVEAVSRLSSTPFIATQIINFFKKQ